MNRRVSHLTAAAFIGTFLTAALFQMAPVQTAAAGAASCESLAALALPGASITAARTVAPGAFTPPAAERSGAVPRGGAQGRGGAEGRGAAAGRGGAAAQAYANLPSFCRVAATLKPSSDSDIKIEVWLPASGWNGKFQAVGNGGWAGSISYPAMAQAVGAGYASASTDTGHEGNTAAFAPGHPEKVIDMGYRAVHEMTVQAKAIINAYYTSAPKLSLWNGCSLGGRQAVTEAERYPADYNAIIAGAAALNWMHLHGVRMAINMIVHRTPDSYIPPEKYPMIHNAVLDACDGLDGVKDGVLENPARCHFDPGTLECKGADGPACLTPAQVETARALYAPVKNPATGAVIFPALLQPGSELGWATLAGPEPLGNAQEAFKYVVFKDPSWDWHTFDAARDLDRADKMDNGVLGLTDPNLKPFFDRGGKLLMYHGWSDPQVASMNSVTYFNDVARTVGRAAIGKSIQLYMVPGMGHCQGGPGTDTFDKVAAMERWVETGRAPDKIIASHLTDGKTDRTRPLCPFGQVATWKGSGSTDDAASFTCAAEGGDRATR
jgi:feruloyl esterase